MDHPQRQAWEREALPVKGRGPGSRRAVGVGDVAGERGGRAVDLAGWERGDFTSVEWAHPEIDYAIVGGLTPDNWKGVAGMAEAARDALNPWETFRIEVEEYRELDGERVLVLWNFKGRGKASGLETKQLRPRGAYLFQIRGGKVIRLAYYVDRAEALEAVGRPE